MNRSRRSLSPRGGRRHCRGGTITGRVSSPTNANHLEVLLVLLEGTGCLVDGAPGDREELVVVADDPLSGGAHQAVGRHRRVPVETSPVTAGQVGVRGPDVAAGRPVGSRRGGGGRPARRLRRRG